jgi:hypothetical protein
MRRRVPLERWYSAARSLPESSPTEVRIAVVSSGDSSWFFGENGSMAGLISWISSAGIHGGAKLRRVKT